MDASTLTAKPIPPSKRPHSSASPQGDPAEHRPVFRGLTMKRNDASLALLTAFRKEVEAFAGGARPVACAEALGDDEQGRLNPGK